MHTYQSPALIELGKPPVSTSRPDWRLTRIQQLVAARGGDSRLTLVHFSKQLGLSTGQLSRLFVRLTGHRFRNFAVAQRLLQASRLLSDTNMPIKQVAAELGYSHSCDLTHRFKKVFGVTPREFRQRASLERAIKAEVNA